MRGILNKLKNRECDVLVLLIVLVASTTLIISVNPYDELWNFANSYKMFNEYKIYEELNVIVTPLFFYIAQIFFIIFGANLLAFRIYNIVICTAFFMLIYLIFKELKIVRRRAFFYTVIIFLLFSTMIASGANYNMLALFPILITILLIIKGKENNIILGILLFLTFMLKQNVFIYFAIGIFTYKLLNTQNRKRIILDLFKIYIISFIGITIFLIYLYVDNNLYNFINYCFLGISEFGANNLEIETNGARFLYVSLIAIILTFIIVYSKKVNKDIDIKIINTAKKITSIGTPLLLICLPIVNYYHATLGSLIIIIEFLYIIDKILISNFKINQNKEKYIYMATILVYIIYVVYQIVTNIIAVRKGEVIFNNNGVFYGTVVSIEDYEDSHIILNYIKEQESKGYYVKILSYKANLYMVQLNKNNGMFDLAFFGNLGLEGENGLINKIKQLENTLILIQTNEEEMFWQESKKAREYIINNHQKVGEIQEYSIYYIDLEK